MAVIKYQVCRMEADRIKCNVKSTDLEEKLFYFETVYFRSTL
jgi:hypothetical protein